MDGYSILYSNSGNLAYSGEDGRGGLVRCGATREDFQNYIMQEIGREHKTEISKLKGGVLGGALKQGKLKVNDEIEIKPGLSSSPKLSFSSNS